MDTTTVVSLVGMFSVGLLCIKKNKFVAAHLIRKQTWMIGNPAALEKQLRTITYFSGWFFCALSVMGAVIFLVSGLR